MTVKALIEEICDFLKGKDHSLTPQLRRLHSAYVEYASELHDEQEELRRMAESLSLADASARARQMDPPLAKRAEMLNFPGREEFLEICGMYDLPPAPAIDFDFIAKLSGPMDASSNKLASLMQEWRRIARTGTTSQRMGLLRKIVAMHPADGAWARNLMEIEKKRYAEIKEFLEVSAGTAALDFQTLDGINQELHSPLLLSRPPTELVRAVLENFLPLQKQRIAERLEECLKSLELSFGEHDNDATESVLRRWNELASNPLAEPDPGQWQYVSDVRNALEREREDAERRARFESLLEQFRNAMADPKTPYSDALALYNQLALMDLPLPDALQEDMDRLTDEHDATERRLHARRIVFGFMGTLVVIVALVASLVVVQRRNRVRKCCEALQASLASEDYRGAIDYVESLSQEDARTVASPEVQSLYEEAKAGQALVDERRRLAKVEFGELKSVLSAKVLEDYLGSGEMEKLLGRLEELKEDLDEEDKKEAIALVASERTAYRQLVLEHEKRFRESWNALSQKMDDLQKNIQAFDDLAQIDGILNEIRNDMARLQGESTIDAGVRAVVEEQYREKSEVLQYVVENERTVRITLEQLRHPACFEEYLQALKEVSDSKDELRFREYRPICGLSSSWSILKAELTAIEESITLGKELPELTSAVGKNYASFLPKDGTGELDKFFQQIQKHFDYYEIIGKDAQKQEYFFYSKEVPVSERDRRNRKDYRYVGFDTDAYANKGYDSFVYVLEKSLSGKDLYRDAAYVTARSARRLPEYFVELEGWQYPAKSDVFRMVEEAQIQGRGGASPLQQVKEMLQKGSEIRNPMIRFWFTQQALEMMKKLSPMSAETADAYLTELKQYPIQVARWKNPRGCVLEQQSLPKVRECLDRMDVSRIILSSDMLWQFLGAFYTRALVPSGVVYQNGSEGLACWFFQKEVPAEACVFLGDELHLVEGGILRGEKKVKSDTAHFFEGQLLWTFADSKKTEEFLQEWRAKCLEKDIKFGVTPDICPKELRYLLR